jgi:hypothetical protein
MDDSLSDQLGLVMAYMIRITRNADGDEGGPAISLAEWIAAVDSHAHVRLADGDYSVTLPETGQVFILRNNGGDAELFFPQANTWRRVFRWDEEDVSFVGTDAFASDATCHLHSIARQLAEALQASIVGDEGELYP